MASPLVEEGAEADSMYLLASGRTEVSLKTADGERSLTQLDAPAYFGEIGLLSSRRSGSVRSLTDVVLWRIPRDRFERVAAEHPALALAVASAAVELLGSRQRQLVRAPIERPGKPRPATFDLAPRSRSLVRRIAGFVIAGGIPVVLRPLSPPGGLTTQGWHVSLILLGAAVGLLLEPLPDFMIALVMAAAWGAAGLAPVSLALAGFTTSSWIVAVGALGLAVAMARSGLLFRIALLFLRTFPATHAGQVLALLLGGSS